MERLLPLLGLTGAVVLGLSAPPIASANFPSSTASPRYSVPKPASVIAPLAEKPSLAPLTGKTSLRLNNCSQPLFIHRVLRESCRQKLVVVLRQTGPRSPKPVPLGTYLSLQGDQHIEPRTFSGKSAVSFRAGPGSGPDTITVVLNEALPADHYTGALVFEVSSGADSVSVPVDVQIRDGPFWPLIVLLAAVALGAVLSWVFDKLLPKANFDKEAATFLQKVKSLPASERKVFLDRWPQVLSERDTDLPTARNHLTALARGIDALSQCRDAQDEAFRTTAFAGLIGWVQRIGSATKGVISAIEGFQAPYDAQIALVEQSKREFGNAREVQETIQSLERRARAARGAGDPYQQFLASAQPVHDALKGVSPDPQQQAPDLAPLIKAAQDSFASLEQAHGSPLPEPGGRAVAAGVGAAGVLASLLGWPAPTISVTLQQARAPSGVAVNAARWLGPVASVVVAVTVLAIGFKTAYLNNATFGATVSDWLSLIIWGLAAYGSRKALTGLGATAAPEK